MLSPQERNALKHYISITISHYENVKAKHKSDFVNGLVFLFISGAFAYYALQLGAIVFFVLGATKLLIHLYLEKKYIPTIDWALNHDKELLDKINGS